MADAKSSEVDAELLILRMAEKEEVALTEFLRAYGGKIKGYLTRLYGDVLKEPEINAALNATAFNVWRFADRYTTAKGSPKTWIIRIARNAAISILRGENRNRAKDLEYDPAYDPSDPSEDCEDDPQDIGSRDRWRAREVEKIIKEELKGNEQAVAMADLNAGGEADSARLAVLLGSTKESIYATRSKVRAKIRKLIPEREARQDRAKGKP